MAASAILAKIILDQRKKVHQKNYVYVNQKIPKAKIKNSVQLKNQKYIPIIRRVLMEYYSIR